MRGRRRQRSSGSGCALHGARVTRRRRRSNRLMRHTHAIPPRTSGRKEAANAEEHVKGAVLGVDGLYALEQRRQRATGVARQQHLDGLVRGRHFVGRDGEIHTVFSI